MKHSAFIIYNITFLILLASVSAFSQTATIRGFVYEKDNGEPVLFTNVYLKGTGYGIATDVNGYYSITKIPAGTYILMVTNMGYDTLQEEVTVKAGDIFTKKLHISKAAISMKEVEISAEKQAKQTEVQVSVNKITPKEIKKVPTIGGEPDLAQYLQVLPGVIFTGDQGG